MADATTEHGSGLGPGAAGDRAATHDASEPGAGTGPRSAWILVVCCLAQFMVILDIAIVNVALPSIQRSLHFTATNLEWVVNAYAIAFGGLLLLGGRAGFSAL